MNKYLINHIENIFDKSKKCGGYLLHEEKRTLSVDGDVIWIGWHFDNVGKSKYPAVSYKGLRLDKVVDENTIGEICDMASDIFGLEY